MTDPPRVIPDVNVLISGITSSVGPSWEIYQAARRFEIIFLLSHKHFDELHKILSYTQVIQLGITPAMAFRLATDLFSISRVIAPLEQYDWVSCPDPKDWYLLDLMETTQADMLITKDKHLLPLRYTHGLPIYEPKEATKRFGWS